MTSEARRRDQDDSGEYSDASQDIEHNNSLNDGQHESDYDSQGSESETSERDPESQETSERRVDDDEDRSNPQYIPKRGTFYEHDDRTAASGEESSNTTSEAASEKKDGTETPSDRRRGPRKSETVNKWSHDKYIENEQVPKSREELVAIYGYDIRNEDAPPHARRNRRYGRGPNKYTRTWEDEEAYRRQNANQPRKPPNPEDFPELDAANNKQGIRKPRMTRPRSKSQPASNESSEAGGAGAEGGAGAGAGGAGGAAGAGGGAGAALRRNASIKTRARPKANKPAPKLNKNDKKLPALENLTITANSNNSQGQPQRKVNATVAQQRPVPTDQPRKKPLQTQPQSSPAPNKSPPQQQNAQQKSNNQQHQPQNAGAESRGGSKRYSSLRQRPLGDSYTPQPQPPAQPQQQQQQQQQPQPQQQQQHRYHNGPGEFTGAAPPHQGSPAAHAPHLMHQVHRAASVPATAAPAHAPAPHAPLAPHAPHAPPITQAQHTPHTQQQQVRLGLLEQQQLVQHPHHSMHNLPQQHAIGQLQQTQGYAPPAMMPAQYMQSGSGAVFGGAAMYAQPPPAPYQHQIYPHHNYVGGQSAGGVTYYSCEQQEQQPRAQRRPTAAIPIVRPHAPDRAANSTEKDNIDRIVENMFVRKPWPATHGADKEKSSDNRSSQEPQSKESSQPNSLTSSSISTDSKPSEKTDKDEKTDKNEKTEDDTKQKEPDATQPDCTTVA